METKHKKFKPFDKVLVKRDWCPEWMCDIYSHYNEESEKFYHTTLTLREVKDENILLYEGNEHLVGTTDEPEEEVKLKKGEWLMIADEDSLIPEDWRLRTYDSITDSRIRAFDNSNSVLLSWEYAIRFKDFDPSNMEETKKHILCVKNGRIIRYKG